MLSGRGACDVRWQNCHREEVKETVSVLKGEELLHAKRKAQLADGVLQACIDIRPQGLLGCLAKDD